MSISQTVNEFHAKDFFFFSTQPTALVIKDFMTMMAICHTAVPERTDNKITYQAASPGQSKSQYSKTTENIYIRPVSSLKM